MKYMSFWNSKRSVKIELYYRLNWQDLFNNRLYYEFQILVQLRFFFHHFGVSLNTYFTCMSPKQKKNKKQKPKRKNAARFVNFKFKQHEVTKCQLTEKIEHTSFSPNVSCL